MIKLKSDKEVNDQINLIGFKSSDIKEDNYKNLLVLYKKKL